MKLSKAELVAWVLGALEPDRAVEVATLVAESPALQRRVRSLQRSLPAWRQAPTRTWNLPPPGLNRASAALVMSGPGEAPGQLRPGARFEVSLPDLPTPEDVQIVVLSRDETDWTVRFPSRPDEQLTLAELQRGPDGRRRLDLSAGQREGLQRWAVALPSRALVADWSAPEEQRWARLKSAIEAGEVTVSTVEVKVSARR